MKLNYMRGVAQPKNIPPFLKDKRKDKVNFKDESLSDNKIKIMAAPQNLIL